MPSINALNRPKGQFSVRPAVQSDMSQILAIYTHYVLVSTSTFEEVPPSRKQLVARWRDSRNRGLPYLVAEEGKQIVGFAYANSYRERSAYRYTVEDSLYVDHEMTGRGIGNALLTALIEQCQAMNLRQLIAIIGDTNNTSSIALHKKHGFTIVGTLKDTGYKFNQWIDTVVMQRSLTDKLSPSSTRGQPMAFKR